MIFHSYVGLPEGILLEHGLCFNAWRPGMAQIACAGMVLHGMAWYGMVWLRGQTLANETRLIISIIIVLDLLDNRYN